ncbi:hypothetical protein HNP81_004616 [Peribacillus huizhouensis]|uniref:Uncharacterized protein n=1 Tax=Peribacillus huizhouensis TaxID=1501239 RepID=A0ABR6CWB1_9BACI|nr:hypothetical protein [Peribacillus huizhouensis]MBA9029244.1 hypothetical protein [Peribacillus huizhouensis]
MAQLWFHYALQMNHWVPMFDGIVVLESKDYKVKFSGCPKAFAFRQQLLFTKTIEHK